MCIQYNIGWAENQVVNCELFVNKSARATYPGASKFSFISNFLNTLPLGSRLYIIYYIRSEAARNFVHFPGFERLTARARLSHFYTMYGNCKKLRLSIFKRTWQLQKLGQLESWAGVFLSQLRNWELELLILFSSCDSCNFLRLGQLRKFDTAVKFSLARQLQLELNPDLRLKFDSWPYTKFKKFQILVASQGI